MRTLAQEHALELERAEHYRDVWQKAEQENISLRSRLDEAVAILRCAPLWHLTDPIVISTIEEFVNRLDAAAGGDK